MTQGGGMVGVNKGSNGKKDSVRVERGVKGGVRANKAGNGRWQR